MKHRIALSLLALCTVTTSFALSDSLSLKEVVVTASRSVDDVRQLPQTVSVVGRTELTNQYKPSILPTLNELIPNLFITSRGVMGYGVSGGAAGGMMLRGLSGGAGQLIVLIDGQPQYNGVYGHPIADAYQTMLAERVEVWRGPASVLYGSNAMGGVLNIVTRQVPRDTVLTNITVGAGSYNTVQTEASNQVRIGKFSSTIGLQYNRTDNHRERMDFQQYGGSLKLGYDFSSHWKGSADLNVIHFDASQPGTVTVPMWDADQWITRGAAGLSVTNQYSGKMPTNGMLRVFSNFGMHEIDDGTRDPETPTQRYFRSRDNLAGFTLYQSVGFFKGNITTFGLDYQHIYGHAYYTSKATGETLDTPNKQSGESHRNEVAAYVNFHQEVAKWLTLDAGLRVDHHSITGTELIPQGGLVFHTPKNGDLKMSVSKGFRNPTMREMYLYPPSNTELEPESIVTYEVAWNQRLLNNRLSYGVNVFYLTGDNMIQQQVVEGKPRNVNTGEVENCGAELTLDYRINSQWDVTTNHSYLHMENPVLAAPTYKGYAGARYHQGRWSSQAGVQYVNGLYTEVGANEDKENFCLFSASVSHRVWRGLTLWLRGETLIGKRHYEVIKGYPLPHATFMGGFSWNF